MAAARHLQPHPIEHTDALVLDYLAALWAEGEHLDPGLRDELMSTVADYVSARRTGDPSLGAAEVLGRLGPPEAIVAAAARGRIPAHLRLPAAPPPAAPMPAPPPAPAGRGADVTAVVLLTAGAFVLPLAGPLAGAVLVANSRRLNQAQKLAAWLLCAVPFLLSVLVVGAGAMMSEPDPAVFLAWLLNVAGPFAAGLTVLPAVLADRPPR